MWQRWSGLDADGPCGRAESILGEGRARDRRQNWPFFFFSFWLPAELQFLYVRGAQRKVLHMYEFTIQPIIDEATGLLTDRTIFGEYKNVAQAGTEPASSSTSEKVRHVRHLSWGPPHLHARVVWSLRIANPGRNFPSNFFHTAGSSR